MYSPVPSTRPSTRRVRSSRTPSTLDVPTISTGRSQKRTSTRRGRPAGTRRDHDRSTSTTPAACRESPVRSPTASSSARASTSAFSSSPSSRSSFRVNFACCGPRRPIMWMRLTRDAASRRSTSSGMSVPRSSSADRAMIRTTSTATFPTPMTTTSSASRENVSGGTSGCPQYQFTKSVAATLPGRSSPGTPSLRSTAAPVQ